MTTIMDPITIINIKMRACLLENDRLIGILEDEQASFEDKLAASNEAVRNIEKFRELCEQETALQMELADLKYAADKAAIERWAENKKRELLDE